MESYGLQGQWSKRIVLKQNLPPPVQKELNEFLSKRKTAAGATIYKDCKTLLLKLHGPKLEATFKAAQNLVMTGTPSQTA